MKPRIKRQGEAYRMQLREWLSSCAWFALLAAGTLTAAAYTARLMAW